MHRDFKGVWIPKGIYLNTELSWTEKIFLIEVHSLQGEEGCWANNQHFAEFLDISEGAVANLITKLKAAGWVAVEGYGKARRLFSKVSSVDESSGEKFHKKMKLVSQKSETSIYRINNTENNTEEEHTISAQFHPQMKPRPKKGTRLPEDFEITAEMVEWADEKGLIVDLTLETEKFKNYWQAVPGSKGVKLDWVATWRNWMLNSRQYKTNGKPQGSTSTNIDKLASYEAIFAKYRSEEDEGR